jgi:histidyl-tRNA synthetase
MKFQAPKGTRDFYPADMAVRNYIFDRWRAVSRRHGFVEYDGPIFETLDLYRVKSGDEIVSELFHFEDRGGREMAIRPEMTPTLARMVAERANALAKPIKWFSMPRLCRAERPQRGRLREFFQWNIDILGEDAAIADAECIFVAADFFRDLGLAPNQVQVRINSRALVAALLDAARIPAERLPAVYAALDKRDKVPVEAFREMLAKLELDMGQQDFLVEIGDARGPEGLERIAARLGDHEAGRAHVARVREVFELLGQFGVAEYCSYDMAVVRGLAYYTGVVFEAFGLGGLRRAIAGGGRYDNLLREVGGPPMGAIGFATSDVVIQDVLAEFSKLPDWAEKTDIFVIDAASECFKDVLSLVGALRAAGYDAQFAYARQNVGKQFKMAANRNAQRVAILDGEFAKTRVIQVKDMATGKQVQMPLEQFQKEPLSPLPEAG